MADESDGADFLCPAAALRDFDTGRRAIEIALPRVCLRRSFPHAMRGDGGARRAQRAQARAAYDATVATYRDTVLRSFQDVEDAVAALSVLEQESATEEDVVKLAQKSVAVSMEQYKAGTVTYLNVVTAQATALANERSAVSLRGRRLVETVALIRALGGGWSSTELDQASR